jgi:hypothetical protein
MHAEDNIKVMSHFVLLIVLYLFCNLFLSLLDIEAICIYKFTTTNFIFSPLYDGRWIYEMGI